MPNMDGTGPAGKGEKTGRQMGKCEGAAPAVQLGGMCGRGMRMGRRMGRGCGKNMQRQ